MKPKMRPILTITGSDGTGGAGIQADIRLISAMGGVAASVITSITVQNTLGIQEFYDLPLPVVKAQIEAIVNDLQPEVLKIGLLRRAGVVEAIAEVIQKYRFRHVVYAPVLKSSRGEGLLSPDVYRVIEQRLLPLCTVILGDTGLTTANPHPHGQSGQLSAAVAFYLNGGDTPDDAIRHAVSYLGERPTTYAEAGSRSEELYNQFIDAVGKYFSRYADVSFYAEQLNVSPRYLGQVTRAIARRSPKAIIDERITSEIVLLLNSDAHIPLKAVALRLGFSSQAHLSRFFKKHKGMSPSEFRLLKA